MESNNDNPKTSAEKPLIGTYLKNAREKRKIDLITVSQKTRINLTILKSLEANKLELLPDKTYLRGFIKSYAKIVGANEEECLDLLNDTFSKLKPENIVISEQREQNNDFVNRLNAIYKPTISMKKLSIGGVFLSLFLASLYLIYSTFKKVKSNPQVAEIIVEKSTLENNQSPLTSIEIPVENNNLGVLPVVTPEAEKIVSTPVPTIFPTVAPTPEVKKTETPKPKPTPQAVSSNTFTHPDFPETIEFTPIQLPMYEIIPNAPEAKNEDLLPSNYRGAIVSGFENVFINANKGDCWLTYKKDDEEIKTFTLQQGRSLLIRGKEVLLFLGNTDSVTVFYNNEYVKFNSKSGVKSFVFPEASSSKYKLPLFIRNKDSKAFTSLQLQNMGSVKPTL